MIPLSLYIHTPWCVRKCPYCDFNSHPLRDHLPEDSYINALLDELAKRSNELQGRQIKSIFIGGGTPSLFAAKSYATLFAGIQRIGQLSEHCEITLEANPGTVEQQRFRDYVATGINRVSIGVQSLNNQALKQLGRIHCADEAKRALEVAHQVGFQQINLDIMYGLPNQSVESALHDLTQALALQPSHFSWYQLTIEPNTYFHRYRPTLPDDDIIDEMQPAGEAILRQQGFSHYEVSAFAKQDSQCQHNLNYWQYGDYIGIGAGSASKITDLETHNIIRRHNSKHPQQYLKNPHAHTQQTIKDADKLFEFMLNTTRLIAATPWQLLQTRTNCQREHITHALNQAVKHNLLTYDAKEFCVTELGRRFLNDLQALFLPS